MPIEFRCIHCAKLLRTGDETAGRQAQCPDCGALMTIPAAPADVPGGSPPPPPSGPTEAGNPFGPSSPFAQPQAAIRPSMLDLAVLGRTWTILKANWRTCLVTALVVWFLNFAVSATLQLIPILGPLAGTLFQVWISIGAALFFLKTARGQAVDIGEIFTGWPFFWRILLSGILVGLIALAILIVSVVLPLLIGLTISQPASMLLAGAGGVVAMVLLIYVMMMLSQYYYLILDRDLGIVESLQISKELMAGNKLTLFLVSVLCVLVAIGASIPCVFCAVVAIACGISQAIGPTVVLGIFAFIFGVSAQLVLMPYLALVNPVIYLTITGQTTADQTRWRQ
jgi:hypothetical protein